MTKLTANLAERTISGLLLPFNEPGRTSKGMVTVKASTPIALASTISLNIEHEPTKPVGVSANLPEVTDEGLVATFSIVETTAGNDLLAEVAAGLRNGLSVEIDDPVIRNGELLGGTLTAAAAVVRPAFPSALLTASDCGDINVEPEQAPAVNDETNNAAAAVESEETPVSNNLTAAVAGGLIEANEQKPKGPETLDQVSRLLANAFKQGGESKMLAALANVTHDDGDNDGDGLGEIAAAPGWLGNVYNDAPYERQFIPLVSNGVLTSYREVGFRFDTKPKVAKYAGNKAEVPTGGMTVVPVNYTVERWAHAADLDRRFIDFGDSDIVRAFIEAQVESYKEETDLETAADILAGATAFVPAAPPSGVNPALAAIVDGLLDLIGKRLKPSFAIVGLDLYREFLFQTKDEVSVFLSETFGLKKGLLQDVTILPTALPAYEEQVVVGDGSTVRFKELGGGAPVRVEAEHVSHGGRDLGVFGYTSFQALKPGGVIRVDLSA